MLRKIRLLQRRVPVDDGFPPILSRGDKISANPEQIGNSLIFEAQPGTQAGMDENMRFGDMVIAQPVEKGAMVARDG